MNGFGDTTIPGAGAIPSGRSAETQGVLATSEKGSVRSVRVGILALQGGVREHAVMLARLGAEIALVRRAEQLSGIDALVLPGGESSAIDRLLRVLLLRDPLRAALAAGLPVLGTCAGMILLAREILDAAPDQGALDVLDVAVRRNAYGRQVSSAEDVVQTPQGPRPHWLSIRSCPA